MTVLFVISVIFVLFSKVQGNVSPQIPGVWDALDALRGKTALPTTDIQEMFYTAVPGVDFPIYSEIPQTNFYCSEVSQAGFYADIDARCQVFRRCDLNGNISSYLCPNMTLFNQITLICDWWYNVDCAQAKNFYDYSNSRLYQGESVVLLDNQDNLSEKGQRRISEKPHRQMRTRTHVETQSSQYSEDMQSSSSKISRINAQSQPSLGLPEMVIGEAHAESQFGEPEAPPMHRKKAKRTRVKPANSKCNATGNSMTVYTCLPNEV